MNVFTWEQAIQLDSPGMPLGENSAEKDPMRALFLAAAIAAVVGLAACEPVNRAIFGKEYDRLSKVCQTADPGEVCNRALGGPHGGLQPAAGVGAPATIIIISPPPKGEGQ